VESIKVKDPPVRKPRRKVATSSAVPLVVVNNIPEHVPGVDGEAEKQQNVIIEPIVLQLSISPSRMDELVSGEDMNSILSYNPVLTDPEPYFPCNRFISDHDNIEVHAHTHTHTQNITDDAQGSLISISTKLSKTIQTQSQQHHDIKCFWCCHNIVDIEYGMPVRYDAFHKSFSVFGSFCSLECTAAYNYSVNMGSNRMWEINSWIQLLGKKYGNKCPIRPAPSKYLLKMFNGPLDINEFRQAHKGLSQTYIMNIPPFIHIPSQMEIINTSFLDKSKHEQQQHVVEDDANSVQLQHYRSTLEDKMNLKIA
jgi:hypothetical protein